MELGNIPFLRENYQNNQAVLKFMHVTSLPYNFFSKSLCDDIDRVIVHSAKDDCSVIKLGDKLLITTTDFVNSNPASLSLGIGTLYDIGYLAVTANISDLAGTGAEPTGFLLGIQLGQEHNEKDYQDIMDGAMECLDIYGVPLLGGDTKKGNSLVVYGVGIGQANSIEELFLSERAKSGTPILISGPIGGFNAAIFALSRNDCPGQLRDSCFKAVLKPIVPLELSNALSRSKMSRAGTDISDGLGADLYRLGELSNIGFEVDASTIPISPLAIEVANHYGFNPIKFAFATGGDYQFLVTGDPITGSTVIGTIRPIEKGRVLNINGKQMAWPNTGHDDGCFCGFSEEVNSLIGSINI
jgi:thiamin-phosphate kinase